METTKPEVCLPAGVTRRLVAIKDGKVEIVQAFGTRAELYGRRDALREAGDSGARFEVWALQWQKQPVTPFVQPDDSWREGLKGLSAASFDPGFSGAEDLSGNSSDWL